MAILSNHRYIDAINIKRKTNRLKLAGTDSFRTVTVGGDTPTSHSSDFDDIITTCHVTLEGGVKRTRKSETEEAKNFGRTRRDLMSSFDLWTRTLK